MNDSDIYQAPSVAVASTPPPVPQIKPPVVTVFGVLHLVFAALGLLMAAWSLLGMIMGDIFSGLTSQQQMAAQAALQDKMDPMTIVSIVCSVVVAVPMIVAGIKLLKNGSGALKWSNIYAYLSLFTKMVSVVLVFVIMVPAMKEMEDLVTGGEPLPGGMSKWISGSMLIGALLGVVVSCIYPVMTLIFLNSRASKAWFAGR